MDFKMKYEVIPKYLTAQSKRRSGKKISKVVFVVAHDTGNPTSTAMNNINYYENSKDEISASAHIFLDDQGIYECIPALTGTPEKAWHVLYQKPKDNQLYGVDANDSAIGIEYCYGKGINADETYKRYVWVLAYTCFKFNLDPKTSITGHFILDPERKTDPKSGLAASGRTFEQLLKDVVVEYEECTKEELTDNIKVVVNNQLVAMGRLIEGHVYVPLRDVGKCLYKSVSWDNLNKIPYVDGKKVAEFKLFDNTTYVQIRCATELFNVKTVWDNTNKKLYIYH